MAATDHTAGAVAFRAHGTVGWRSAIVVNPDESPRITERSEAQQVRHVGRSAAQPNLRGPQSHAELHGKKIGTEYRQPNTSPVDENVTCFAGGFNALDYACHRRRPR